MPQMQSRFKLQLAILLALVGYLVFFGPDSMARRFGEYSFFDSLVDIRTEIERNYVTEPDGKKMLEGAINGMIEPLNDPYTTYLDPEQLEGFDKSTRGSFSGIGAEIEVRDGELRIVSPLEDSPAFKAGVLAQDIIKEIDGKPTKGVTVHEAVEMITGPEGTPVKLTIIHPNGDEEVLTIIRARIKIQTVKGFRRDDEHHWDFMLDDALKIGYVRLTQFTQPTLDELVAALKQFQDRGGKGLILDLRFNPGGLLDVAVSVSDQFLQEGKIVSTRGRQGPSQTWRATDDGVKEDFPMIVMVNGFSASASEIVSGALKDNDRAVVLGTRSFGKGSVQQVIGLEGGNGALKLTTAYYYLPSGRNLHRREESETWGVDPTDGFYVSMTVEQRMEMARVRRETDVLNEEDGNGGGDEKVSPDWIRDELKDIQLAAAVEAMTAKIEDGEFKKVGRDNATALTFVMERENLIRQRRLLLERVEEIDKEMVEIEETLAQEGVDVEDLERLDAVDSESNDEADDDAQKDESESDDQSKDEGTN